MGWTGGSSSLDAIHDNVSGEIDALTEVTPVTGDWVLIEDTSDSDNKKKVDAGDFLSAGGGLTQYEDIASGTVSTLEVSSIASGGKNLLVTGVLRSDRSAEFDDLEINVGNGTIDTGSNYRWYRVFDGSGEGESASESDTKLYYNGAVSGANADSGNFATLEMLILDYAATAREKFFTLNIRHYRATSYYTMDGWGRWESNSAIDIVRLTSGTGDWVADSLMRITEL